MPTSRTFQLDVDTKRYCNRVNSYRLLNGLGNLLPPDVADIDNFVVGLKDLGVWGGTNCWILNNIHNVGVVSTFTSLGGGGVFNGSFFNNPYFDNQGVVLSNPSQQYGYVLGPQGNSAEGLTLWTVQKGDPVQVTFALMAYWQNFNVNNGNISITRGGTTTSRASIQGSFADLVVDTRSTNFFSLITKYKMGENLSFKIPSLAQSNTTVSTPVFFNVSEVNIGTRGRTASTILNWTGKISLVFTYKGTLAFNVNQSLYDLYKTTIGKNLGLA